MNTAIPADSGPRAAISISIGVINAPSWSRMAGFLISSPTIPHIAFVLRKHSLLTREPVA